MFDIEFKSTQSGFLEKNRNFNIAKLVIFSEINEVKTNNSIYDIDKDNNSGKQDDFVIALDNKYFDFKNDFIINVSEAPVESGVHYEFENIFDKYFIENPYMASKLLERLLREYYENIKIVKAILHIVSHYDYSEIGEYFIFPVSSLCHHINKGVRKFALKVFDNWDSVDTLSVLRGTQVMREKWLNDYRTKIIQRLERKQSDAISFACN